MHHRGLSGHRRRSRRDGFSLVELLVVIGIIGLLLALLMPALVNARRAAVATQCASNLRQLTTAMINYATESKGTFPGNVGSLNLYWYNRDQIGRYLKGQYLMSDSEQSVHGVFVCPADLPDAVRCYSMNIYASSLVSPFVQAALDATPPRGKLFKLGVADSSHMILLAESFSFEDFPSTGKGGAGTGETGKWSSPAVVGFAAPTPGQLFNHGGYLGTVRFGDCDSQLCYFRHRSGKSPAGLGNAYGRLNIGFADGHVSLHSHGELWDPDTGRSTYLAMWSPIDRDID